METLRLLGLLLALSLNAEAGANRKLGGSEELFTVIAVQGIEGRTLQLVQFSGGHVTRPHRLVEIG